MITVESFLIVMGVICFLLSALRVQSPIDFFPLGWAFLAATLLF